MLQALVIDQHVEGLAQRLQERFSSELGLRNDIDRQKSASFVFLVAQTVLDLEDDETIDGLVDGGGDFGVDAIYFGPADNGEFPVTLVQGKYKRKLTADSSFPESGIEKMCGALRILFDPQAPYSANPRLTNRVEELRSLIREGQIPAVRIILCNNGQKWNHLCQQRIDTSGFAEPMVAWQHVGPEALVSLLRKTPDIQARLQLSGRALVENHDFVRSLVGRLSVSELARLFNEHGDGLLERNIRRYLGITLPINEQIATTLKDPQQQGRFYFYNNGITIICSQFRHNDLQKDDWIVHLSGLQIVNGGQTAKTIQQIYNQRQHDGHEDGLTNASVMVRIYELPVDEQDLVQRITEATNSQTPVDLRDLRSNDRQQKDLADSVALLGYHYRRQRHEAPFGAQDITSTTAAEAILAIWRCRPHAARFAGKDHFGKLYELIFAPSLNGAQIIQAVLLLRFAENKRKRPPVGMPDFLQYGSRHVAMLMGKFLLADLKSQLTDLTHQTFANAEKLRKEREEDYFQQALRQIEEALQDMFGREPPSLQRLSATFRRADLVENLLGHPIPLNFSP